MLDTLTLAGACWGPVGLLGSRLFRNAARGLLAWGAGVGCCGGDREVGGGTGCFGFFTDFGDAFRDSTGGGTLDAGGWSHLFSMVIVRSLVRDTYAISQLCRRIWGRLRRSRGF